MVKRVLLGLFVVAVIVAGYFISRIGPRNLLGMLRYDQRQEGTLRVGDRAPDVALLALDGKTPMRLSGLLGGRPTVLVFGSFT